MVLAMSVVPETISVPESPLRRNAAWLLVALAYLYSFPYFERMNNPNENTRVWTTRAIVEHHRLSIDQVEREWGWVNDAAIVQGRLYSSKAPGMSVIGVPVYAVQAKVWHALGWPSPSKRAMTLALRLFCVGVPMAFFLLLFARWAERITRSRTARDLLVVGLGAGTMLYPYSTIFVGHAVGAALAFSAYMLLSTAVPGHHSESGRLFGAGALTGLSVCFEYQLVLVALALTAYTAVVFRRHVLLFVLGMLPPALVLATYQTMVFGRPWELPQGHIENAAFAEHHKPGFFGLAGPRWRTMGWTLFSPAMGLFAFSPFLVLGLLGAIWAAVRRPRHDGVLILSVFAVMVVFLSGIGFTAGWCVGPRYIAVVAPFLVAGLAHAWPRERSPFWLGVMTAGLVIPSVFLNGVSAAVFPHYPQQYDNPVFDLTLPLLATGHAPYSVGRLLHLRGAWSLLPLAAILLLAVALGAAGEDRRRKRWIPHVVLACIVAALFMTPLARYGRRPDAGERHATSVVESFWEPRY